MGRKYKHISPQERDEISNLYAKGQSISAIAIILKRSKSTISNELRRNSTNKGYYSQQANETSRNRWSKAHKRNRIPNMATRRYMEEKLKRGWTPEQISGRLKLKHPQMCVSYETIYQYIYECERVWCLYLPRKHTHRYKKSNIRKTKRTLIPNRISINQRPLVVELREEFGHFEADSVVSRKSKSALNTMVERKSRFTMIKKIESKTAENTSIAMSKSLHILPKHSVKTVTFDNGLEFVLHTRTNEEFQSQSYFCEPYHSWEKGSIENRNGIIRRYLPKGTDFDTITDVDIKWIQDRINNTPMKCLGYKTPTEVFEKECNSVSLAS